MVAEGAETADQVARLDALECDQIQGYFYSRPTTSARADVIARHGLAALEERRAEQPAE